MPYIEQALRNDVDKNIDELNKILQFYGSETIDGVMNYIITRLVKENYDLHHYWQYNAAIGMLECAKLEFYRRTVSKYENGKIKENGDV